MKREEEKKKDRKHHRQSSNIQKPKYGKRKRDRHVPTVVTVVPDTGRYTGYRGVKDLRNKVLTKFDTTVTIQIIAPWRRGTGRRKYIVCVT